MRFFIVCEGAGVRKILADDCPAIYIWNNFCLSGHYVDVDFVSFFREKGAAVTARRGGCRCPLFSGNEG